MPRKKIKHSKLTNKSRPKLKKRVKETVSCLSEAMEKDFNDLPKQLPIQFGKDIAALKKRESKLTVTIKKMEKQKNQANKNLSALTAKLKNKSTPAIKKQLKALTTESGQLNQMLSSLNVQLTQTNKQINLLSHKQAKFAALSKEIAKLDKQWEKKKILNEKPLKQPRKKRLNIIQPDSVPSANSQLSIQENSVISNPENLEIGSSMEESQEV